MRAPYGPPQPAGLIHQIANRVLRPSEDALSLQQAQAHLPPADAAAGGGARGARISESGAGAGTNGARATSATMLAAELWGPAAAAAHGYAPHGGYGTGYGDAQQHPGPNDDLRDASSSLSPVASADGGPSPSGSLRGSRDSLPAGRSILSVISGPGGAAASGPGGGSSGSGTPVARRKPSSLALPSSTLAMASGCAQPSQSPKNLRVSSNLKPLGHGQALEANDAAGALPSPGGAGGASGAFPPPATDAAAALAGRRASYTGATRRLDPLSGLGSEASGDQLLLLHTASGPHGAAGEPPASAHQAQRVHSVTMYSISVFNIRIRTGSSCFKTASAMTGTK